LSYETNSVPMFHMPKYALDKPISIFRVNECEMITICKIS